MGEHEGWAQPNGLLPSAGSLIPVLDSERWLKAEERTAELIACIQPNQPSEERRNAVADYVQRLVMKCFPCQVFTFGSVPLKTYLPDGDIDLTAFCNNQNLKETWATQVRDMLVSEEKDENAEFRVKEVQYIQAEVKIIKCLVENIVVDISFNQLGGLCTLCFLEEVDHLINQNHLFKRSIILIKAWCYYESRILGAHHGLISTYALETLVLYIFHVFNNSFAGPLEVLYRFLEFFSNFDWENFCVSLWGPVPISSLPDVTAEPPRKDSGELLLSKLFLDACSSVYAVFPAGQENQGQPFVSKHFNVIDPLRLNNNLGRSVSKGNFFRIRSAFAFGAKKLARLLDCPKENLLLEVNQFFMNTWDRHGGGIRPDAPATDSGLLGVSTQDHVSGSDNRQDSSSVKKVHSNSSDWETKVEGTNSNVTFSQHGNHYSEGMSRTSDISTASHTQSQKSCGNLNNQRISNQIREISSDQVMGADKGQRNLKSNHLLNDIHGRFLFTRTHSSPELTESYGDVSAQGRHNRELNSGKNQAVSADSNGESNSYHQNRRRNPGSELSPNHSGQITSDEPSSVSHVASHQYLDPAARLNSGSNKYHLESGSRVITEELPSVVAPGMHQEDQDIVNMMASSSIHGFNRQVQVPMNLSSINLPFPISPSVIASMGYAQRNMAGIAPTNIPFIDHSFPNMQFPHGFVSPPLSHYFSGTGVNTNSEDSVDHGNETVGSSEMNSGDADHHYWQEQDIGTTRSFDSDIGNLEMLHSDDKQHSTSSSFNFVPSYRTSGSGSSMRGEPKYSREKRGSMQEDRPEDFLSNENRGNEVYSDERTTSSRFSSAAHSSSLRSKTSSESSWDEPSTKVTKSTREKRGKKTSSTEPSLVYERGEIVSEHVSIQPGEDPQDWNHLSNMNAEMTERSSRTQSSASLQVTRHHLPGYESVETSVSDSMIPMSPMLFGPGSQQRMMGNNGSVFYPTGPPVPFLTMLQLYDVPPNTGTSDASTCQYGGEEGLDNVDPIPNEVLDQSGVLNTASFETSDERKPDILNGDFPSHWQNLQYGRFCQNPRYNGSVVYPSPVMVPPFYLQGRFSWDGPGRPPSGNMNTFPQFLSYGPRLVPVAPIQSVSSRPLNVYQRYVDDMPRYRSGTGTYLPNPKVSVRDRHPSGSRRGNYNYDRSDNNGDREGSWNNSRSRATGRSHYRNQSEKSSSRPNRLVASENRAERSWNSYRNDLFPSSQLQNGPSHSNSSQGGPPNVPYGMFSVPAMNPSVFSSNGPTVRSVVMMYPYDHNSTYGSQAEQLEFGSFGPVSVVNEQSHLSEGSRARGAFDDHTFQGGPAHHSSSDQPSSPHHHRSVAQRIYRTKDEDFPTLASSNQVENGRWERP